MPLNPRFAASTTPLNGAITVMQSREFMKVFCVLTLCAATVIAAQEATAADPSNVDAAGRLHEASVAGYVEDGEIVLVAGVADETLEVPRGDDLHIVLLDSDRHYFHGVIVEDLHCERASP